MGTTTCHRLTGDQRPGHRGDQLGMRLPKMGVGTRRSEPRLLSDSPPHIGETEAQSSTPWPGSPSTRPQTTGSARPLVSPGSLRGPGPLPGQQLPSHLPQPGGRRRGAAGRVQNKRRGGRGGGGAEAIRGGGPERPSRPSSPGADGSGHSAPRRGTARPPAAFAAAARAAAAAAGVGPAAAGECPPPAGPLLARGCRARGLGPGTELGPTGRPGDPGAARYPKPLLGPCGRDRE